MGKKIINPLLEVVNKKSMLINPYMVNQSTLRSGLLAEWLFSGNTNDTSDNGYNATNYGASLAIDRKGVSNRAYNFSGAQYIDAPTIPVSGSISVNIWCKISSAGSYFMIMKEPVNTNWGILTQGGSLIWRSTTGQQITYTWFDTNWHMITCTQVGTSAKMYFDGALVSSGTIAAIGNTTGKINIARYSGGYYYRGLLDDIKIYNRELSVDEIASLYAE